MKSREGESKWLLRRVLDRYLPTTLFDRPKMGFGVPIDAWLRGPLREWAEELLKPGKLQQSGLRSEPIRLKWSEHVDGVRNWQYPLWNALMFQAWFAQN
jgi:asparagine synthase (glutamine-hydrolysing)